MTKCVECGADRVTVARREDHRMPPGVVLEGVVVERCEACGEEYYTFPQPEGVERALTRHVLNLRRRLTGAEVRYLRMRFGPELEAKDVAALLGVAPETFSRWENGHMPIGVQSDRALRLLLAQEKGERIPLDVLRAAEASAPETADEIRMRFDARAGWLIVGVTAGESAA